MSFNATLALETLDGVRIYGYPDGHLVGWDLNDSLDPTYTHPQFDQMHPARFARWIQEVGRFQRDPNRKQSHGTKCRRIFKEAQETAERRTP